MGGVLINGCGTSDSLVTMRTLPGRLCRVCKKADYALMEVKRKVRVFYIPVVSINTKYAIACPKCKEGYYISEEQKNIVLREGSSCVEILADGVRIHGTTKAAVVDAPADDEIYFVDEGSQTVCSCGATLMPGAKFCTKCGSKAGNAVIDMPEPPVTGPAVDEELKPEPEKVPEVSTEPEKPLEVKAELEKIPEIKFVVPPVVPENKSFAEQNTKTPIYRRGKLCPECGMRSLPDKEICSICGTKL